MLLIFLVWLVAWAACLVLGVAISRLYLIAAISPDKNALGVSEYSSMGLVVLFSLALIFSLWAPVDERFVIGVGILLYVLFMFFADQIIGALLRPWRRYPCRTIIYLLILSLASIPLLVLSSQNIKAYDTFLYHLNTLRWVNEYGTVPGIANLHGRLGFNSSLYAFSSLFSVGVMKGLSSHFSLSFFSVCAVARGIALAIFAKKLSLIMRITAGIFSFTLICLGDEISSLSTDFGMGVACTLFALELLVLPTFTQHKMSFREKLHRLSRRYTYKIFLIASFGVITCSIKMSGVVFLLSGMILSGLFIFSLFSERTFRSALGQSALVLVVPFSLGLAHVARNIMVSGWLAYPIPWFDLLLPWGTSVERAQREFNSIRFFAQTGGTAAPANFLAWFVPWFATRFGFYYRYLVGLGLMCALIGLCTPLRGARVLKIERIDLRFGLCFLTLVGTLLQWFTSAPSVRFIAMVFPLFFFTFLGLFLEKILDRRWQLVLLLLLSYYPLTYQGSATLGLLRENNESGLLSLDRAPSADLATTVFAQDGKLIEFFSPIGSELCLDSPLPCTPFLNYMPWRDAASIKAGFPPLNCVKEGAPCSDLVEKTVNLFDTQGISNEAKSTGES